LVASGQARVVGAVAGDLEVDAFGEHEPGASELEAVLVHDEIAARTIDGGHT